MKVLIVTFLIAAMLALSACDETVTIEAEGVTTSSQQDAEQSSDSSGTTANNIAVTQLSYPSNDFIDEFSDAIFMEDQEVFITQSGIYEFSGNYSEIVVNVNKDTDEGVVYLVLNNVNIETDTGTPINIIEAKDVALVLMGENTVTQGAVITDDSEFPSAAVYSSADTAIIGDGALVVNTLYRDGINSRDDLVIEGVNIAVSSIEDGILGKDLLAISDSTIMIACGKDGLKASNDVDLDRGNIIITGGSYDIVAQNDAISAEQILQIDDGVFKLYSGGGYVEVLNEITMGEGSGNIVQPTDLLEDSMKGIKANDIVIAAGEFIISSYEDAIHADNSLTINAGSITINSGDDALHADYNLIINSVNLIVENAYEGIEGSTITINGGDINVNVLDDAINASADDGYITITGGVIYLRCQGDGIDSNGDLTIEGGDIVIEANSIYSGGDGALDVTGVYSISGGSITDENGNSVDVLTTAQGGNRPGGTRPGGTVPGR